MYAVGGGERFWSEDLRRRPRSDYPSLAHHYDIVGPLGRGVDVVKNCDDSHLTLAGQGVEAGEYALLIGGVEIGGRFIEEEESRRLGQGPRETYHLALPLA